MISINENSNEILNENIHDFSFANEMQFEKNTPSNDEIVESIIDEYINNGYKLKKFHCDIMKNAITNKINDKKLLKNIFDYLEEESTSLSTIMLHDFLFLFFEYLLDLDYICLGKKAKMFSSMLMLIFDLYDKTKEDNDDLYAENSNIKIVQINLLKY